MYYKDSILRRLSSPLLWDTKLSHVNSCMVRSTRSTMNPSSLSSNYKPYGVPREIHPPQVWRRFAAEAAAAITLAAKRLVAVHEKHEADETSHA